jgi:hypothetical protein
MRRTPIKAKLEPMKFLRTTFRTNIVGSAITTNTPFSAPERNFLYRLASKL